METPVFQTEIYTPGSRSLTTGLAITFERLAASRNDAANSVLLAALEGPLESQSSSLFDGALKTIIARRHKGGHLTVLQRWHTLSTSQRETLQEGRGRLSGALRDAVLAEDDQLFTNACELVEQFKEFDLVSTLVTLAENQKSKHAEAATELVLRLVQQLSEMAHGSRDYQDSRNPASICRFVLESLERSVERFRTHNRTELIEAFVILAGPTSRALGQILDDPYHPCYLTVINTLTTSRTAGVIDFLLRSLQSKHTPLNLLNVISKRDDPEFVTQLLDSASDAISTKTAKNLERIRSFAWLQAGERGYENFDEQAQASCIKLVAASGVKPDEFLDLLENILKRGAPVARWAACEALASIPGDRGNNLILKAVEDSDPKVQAAATRQVRDRHVSGAMTILLKQIDSPHEAVREATCEALAEFSFANFLTGFEGLQEDSRRSMGALVKKVDPETIPGLLAEMEVNSHKRRLRAIEMSEVMEVVPQVAEGLLFLLEDEDHLIRAASADVLQFCPTAEVQEALRRAANDPSGTVQSATKSSLEIFDELSRSGKAGTLTSTEAQQ